MARRGTQARSTADLDTVRGELVSLRVVGDDFWSIAVVSSPAAGGVSVVGKLLGVRLGDTVEVLGFWSEHPKFGRQFKSQELRTVVPSEASGIVAWMASRLPQMGRTRAAALVERIGAEHIWNVIEQQPDRLLEVEGITPARRDEIVKAYAAHRGERDRMVWFKRLGFTDNQIGKVLAAWGEKAEEILRDDPYRLASEVHGFGFLRADAIAIRMGLPLDSPARIRAGLVHILCEAESAGHCFVPWGKWAALAARELKLDERLIHAQMYAVIDSGMAMTLGPRVYTPAIAKAEDGVAAGVLRMLGRKQAAA